jgi:hypothetical protein
LAEYHHKRTNACFNVRAIVDVRKIGLPTIRTQLLKS